MLTLVRSTHTIQATPKNKCIAVNEVVSSKSFCRDANGLYALAPGRTEILVLDWHLDVTHKFPIPAKAQSELSRIPGCPFHATASADRELVCLCLPNQIFLLDKLGEVLWHQTHLAPFDVVGRELPSSAAFAADDGSMWVLVPQADSTDPAVPGDLDLVEISLPAIEANAMPLGTLYNPTNALLLPNQEIVNLNVWDPDDGPSSLWLRVVKDTVTTEANGDYFVTDIGPKSSWIGLSWSGVAKGNLAAKTLQPQQMVEFSEDEFEEYEYRVHNVSFITEEKLLFSFYQDWAIFLPSLMPNHWSRRLIYTYQNLIISAHKSKHLVTEIF